MSRSESSRPSSKKPTIYDLARITGVSPGTVSRVLNNRDKVKSETRDRVLRAATELNLKPQAAVRTRQVAILSEPEFPDRVEGYAATMTAHLSFAFSKRDIGVLQPTNPCEDLPGMFLDGVIAVTFGKALRALLAELEQRMPVVYLDNFALQPNELSVNSDHVQSGWLAARHFIERGRKKPAFLGGDFLPFAARLRGFKQALAEAGLPVDDRCTTLFGPEINHVSVVTRMIRAGADAIYAPGSSFQAIECLHILTYVMGLKVPQDVALIGGENEGISCFLNPPLTTIEEPLRDMAERAAAMLDSLTRGETVAEPQITLPVRLIERDSVA
ncbi:catabolite control protein A [Opitutales bacterium ASA1]|uniref:LacI family DNA-binding transcriptional regulator n=1 Tax=Congregicoccus parvus TaxID=3081749 RepID=UPI002B292734|nr:catabolite control protein A [Opitutales bacterium ASA1]